MDLVPPCHRRSLAARPWKAALAALAAASVLACGSGSQELPTPRPIVVRSGARLFPDKERLQAIDAWFRPQEANIQDDPSFMIEQVTRDTPAYPWESLLLIPKTGSEGTDTAKIGLETKKSPEAGTAYSLYAHFRLMKEMGRLEEFLPGATALGDFALEREILSRVADVWFLGRSAYNATAYEPLEELLYAKESGHLDAFILTARGEEFSEERRAWLQEDPEALERYRQWFVATFSREPPGLRGGGGLFPDA